MSRRPAGVSASEELIGAEPGTLCSSTRCLGKECFKEGQGRDRCGCFTFDGAPSGQDANGQKSNFNVQGVATTPPTGMSPPQKTFGTPKNMSFVMGGGPLCAHGSNCQETNSRYQ